MEFGRYTIFLAVSLAVCWVQQDVASAQGMNGGAAEAKGASGTSNPNGDLSTNAKSPAVRRGSAAAANNKRGNSLNKSGHVVPSSAAASRS
nr:hypothetical protein HUO10_005385 [Paraburkholderia busanensis]